MDKMSTEALVFMLSVWALVISATGYSFYRLLSSKRQIGGSDDERE